VDRGRAGGRFLVVAVLTTAWGGAVPFCAGQAAPAAPVTASTHKPAAPADRGYTYSHQQVDRVPWSIYVVKMSRGRPGLEIDTLMGHGTAFGMATVSEMVELMPKTAGKAVAAINGDFFNESRRYPGDPDGLQIVRGELVSAPHRTRVCCWIDAQGNPHRTNVLSLFHVVWPGGTRTQIGLNEERGYSEAVLYTAAAGPSTRTYGGRELTLVAQTNSGWLPLRIGQSHQAVVKSINDSGNSPIPRQSMVLSIGPHLLQQIPRLAPGAVIGIATLTSPNLAGARMGIGGGPTLVAAGKPWRAGGYFQMRHPRSAFGWNKDYFFLVEVDGRQPGAAGMTFAELSNYMISLGCEEAINLDGGGSTTLWVDGRVVNSPSEGMERPSVNGIVVVQRPTQ